MIRLIYHDNMHLHVRVGGWMNIVQVHILSQGVQVMTILVHE